ncbi:iron complex transport system ATP-binding protein [Nakamurella sp. UYEF19]|uniref:ABC transporter ATP-binding protein n=1 Tax=Nakamurella sp. UYEF19 TaxID=1756392 RepID=UPI003396A5E7
MSVTLGSRTVLSDIELNVDRGDWLCVIGPNGAGKSTLLRYLAGIVTGRGSLDLSGKSSTSLNRRQRAQAVALVPQTPVIPDGITVTDYVLLGRAPHIHAMAVESRRDLHSVHEALVQLDLMDMADRVVGTLSGGERQRVLLARALAQDAPILLLDEPTTALDVGHQQQVLELIETLRRERHLAVISTMHDLTLAGQYADRLMLLNHGLIVAQGTAEEVLTEATVARFYGARVRIVLDEDGRPAVLPVRGVLDESQ